MAELARVIEGRHDSAQVFSRAEAAYLTLTTRVDEDASDSELVSLLLLSHKGDVDRLLGKRLFRSCRLDLRLGLLPFALFDSLVTGKPNANRLLALCEKIASYNGFNDPERNSFGTIAALILGMTIHDPEISREIIEARLGGNIFRISEYDKVIERFDSFFRQPYDFQRSASRKVPRTEKYETLAINSLVSVQTGRVMPNWLNSGAASRDFSPMFWRLVLDSQ